MMTEGREKRCGSELRQKHDTYVKNEYCRILPSIYSPVCPHSTASATIVHAFVRVSVWQTCFTMTVSLLLLIPSTFIFLQNAQKTKYKKKKIIMTLQQKVVVRLTYTVAAYL